MDPVATAVLASWTLDWGTLCLLLAVAALYLRGWLRLHAELPRKYTTGQAASLSPADSSRILLALESPVDAFGALLLQAHMIQHLLLIMVAPPLLLLGQPVLPLLRGLAAMGLQGCARTVSFLPRAEATRPRDRSSGRDLVRLVGCRSSVWHLPRLYELALHSQAWHQVEHACFFWSADPVLVAGDRRVAEPSSLAEVGHDSVSPAGGHGEHWASPPC